MKAWQLPFGAQPHHDGNTRFRFWAPDCRAVAVVIDGGEPLPMHAANDGWFALEAAAAPGARYRYRLDDKREVPDPAARAQAGGVHGASVVVDPTAYRWQHADWRGRPWHEAVVYELHVGLCGGFKGVEAKLAGLAELGISVIELMPIAQFPGARNWGYDGVLPFAPAEAYGSPDALRQLIDTAHGLGLSVLLDVVYNHFGPDGNFLHAYANGFFRDDRHTGWGAAIDFRRPQVREFFIENALYWLSEYRFDGLRLDAVHAIADNSWLRELASRVHAEVGPMRHVHLVLENEDNAASLLAASGESAQRCAASSSEPLRERDPQAAFDAQWNDDGHHALHVLLTGEHEAYYEDYADGTNAHLARTLSEGFVYQGEVSKHRGNARGELSTGLPSTAFVLFLQNHDQIGNRAFGERLLTLCDPAAYRAAAGLVLLSPQIPMLFMGEEFGAREPFLFFTDHAPELAEKVRIGRRNEFARFAAFNDPERRARIPDPNAESSFAASIPQPAADADAWRAFYRELIGLRRAQIVPRLSGTRSLEAVVLGRAAVSAAWRMGDGSRLTLYANLAPEPVMLPAPDARLLYATGRDAETLLRAGHLAPHSTLLLYEVAA